MKDVDIEGSDDGSTVAIVAGSVLLIAGIAVGTILGLIAGEERTKITAVKAGAAEYYLDANHNRQFRWKGQQQ